MQTVQQSFQVGRILPLIAAGAVLIAGCGQRSVRYEMLPVEGSITFQGQPLAGAEVMLDSIDGPRGFGVTDETGRFTVMTRQYGPGLPAGDYRVFVTGSEQTRLAGSGRVIAIATAYGESGVGRVTIDQENLTVSFDLDEKPQGGRPRRAEDPGAA